MSIWGAFVTIYHNEEKSETRPQLQVKDLYPAAEMGASVMGVPQL